MNLKYILQDDKGNQGTTLTIEQGEIRIITVFLLQQSGAPYTFVTPTELVVKLFEGVSTPSLQKKLSLSTVTLITGNGGNIGFSFQLLAADTAALPVSSTLNMSAVLTNTGVSDIVDFQGVFSVVAPLVIN